MNIDGLPREVLGDWFKDEEAFALENVGGISQKPKVKLKQNQTLMPTSRVGFNKWRYLLVIWFQKTDELISILVIDRLLILFLFVAIKTIPRHIY